MIQAITETNLTTYLETEDNRIDTTVGSDKIRHLVKFINDMDKAVFYAYPSTEVPSDRYTECQFIYNATPNMFSGQLKLTPAGYYKYEVYEVTWTGTVSVSADNAPRSEDEVLPSDPDHGIVQGLVGIGKLYLAEKTGFQQVQYLQHPEPSGTNYIYTG